MITVITINYNNNAYLKETIESVLNQTCSDFEYILIDNNSYDGSKETIESYENSRKDIHYRWISEPDKGISDAFNKGIKMARGEVIGLLNSGDLYEKNALEIAEREYKKTNYDLFYGDTMKIDDEGNKYSYTKAGSWKKIFLGLTFMHSACFVPKRVYEESGYFSEKYKIAMDIELLLRIYKQYRNIHFVNELVSYQRIGGLSHQNVLKGIAEYRKIALILFPQRKWEITYYIGLRTLKYLLVRFLIWIRLRKVIKKLISRQ